MSRGGGLPTMEVSCFAQNIHRAWIFTLYSFTPLPLDTLSPLLYNPAMRNDTIAAIGTPARSDGIGIIRVSRPEAFSLVLPLLRRSSGNTGVPHSNILTHANILYPYCHEAL